MIAGGHIDRFSFDPTHGDKILFKMTNEYEIQSFEKVFNTKNEDELLKRRGENSRNKANLFFQKFLPKYYGYCMKEEGVFQIKLENLLADKPHASVLDLKMGTTSITVNTPLENYDKVRQKDKKTTTVTHGIRVTALLIKDKNGQVSERIRKP